MRRVGEGARSERTRERCEGKRERERVRVKEMEGGRDREGTMGEGERE